MVPKPPSGNYVLMQVLSTLSEMSTLNNNGVNSYNLGMNLDYIYSVSYESIFQNIGLVLIGNNSSAPRQFGNR